MRRLQPGMALVAARELRWMCRDRLALALSVGIPLFAFAILAWTFSNAVVRDLRISIVDADHSATSMLYVQSIGSTSTVTVAERSSDLASAMDTVRAGKAIAAVYIPVGFERDVIAGNRPQIVIFYNRQFMTPGNNANSSISAAINAATASLSSRTGTHTYAPGPLVIEEYVLTNPAMNYGQFLLRAILPTILHVVAALAGGYAVGSEFSMRSRATWLATAGGSPLAALVGKLMPLFGIFLLMMGVAVAILHGVYDVPFRGSPVMTAVAAALLLIAYLSLGALLQLLVRNMALGFSLTGIICSPAFGFAGVGFPVLGMSDFARGWGNLLPLRWYIQVLFDQAARGVPAAQSAGAFGALGGLAVGLFLLAWWRLSVVVRQPTARGSISPRSPEPPQTAGIGVSMLRELRLILHDSGTFGLIVLAPILYGALYPQPYLGQLLRKLPIAVVDNDQTELSRSIIQNLAADEALSVPVHASTLADAQAALQRHEVYGILSIPSGTERESLKSNPARLPIYVDSAYFLVFSRIVEGMSGAIAATSSDLATRGARADGSLARSALVGKSPVELLSEPLFNPTGGYANYVVPAAFMLILQQTLFLGAATAGSVSYVQTGGRSRRLRAGPRAVIGHALAHLVLSLPGFALYLVILPHIYGFPTLGRPLDMVLMLIPFVLSVSFLAQFLSVGFKRRESAMLLFMAVSLPLFFFAGVSWPIEALPEALRTASQSIPTTSAIDGLVRINQMGASLHEVWHDWTTLWILTAIYGLLAIISTVAISRRGATDAL